MLVSQLKWFTKMHTDMQILTTMAIENYDQYHILTLKRSNLWMDYSKYRIKS